VKGRKRLVFVAGIEAGVEEDGGLAICTSQLFYKYSALFAASSNVSSKKKLQRAPILGGWL
jgi:hypothetical protein